MPAASLTIHSKHILDLLLDHPQRGLNAVGAGHGVDVIGIEATQIQNLGEKEGLTCRAWPAPLQVCPTPAELYRLAEQHSGGQSAWAVARD